jgi:naringenin degradation protein FdeI
VKVATLKDGTREGRLVVVSRDLARAADAQDIAPTLLAAIEAWGTVEPALRGRAEQLESGALEGEPFDPSAAHAPLPRAPQWIDGSVFANHGRLMANALHPDRENSYQEYPLVYQGASDDFIGPCDDVVVAEESEGIDFEGEVAVIVDEVPMRTRAADADARIKLLLLCNDVSLRSYVARELSTGFGFFNAKPSSAFSPVAVTPDELGDAWKDGRFELPLLVHWNDELFGRPNAREMTFTFHQLIEHVTRSRRLSAGTIIGSGTVSNEDRAAGSACIAERRAIELIDKGAPETSFMRFGDRVRMEMLDVNGASVFGAIDQRIVSLDEALAARDMIPTSRWAGPSHDDAIRKVTDSPASTLRSTL